jgi:hypothetical protein
MLFQDTTANALCSTVWYHGGGGDEMTSSTLFFKMLAGTTSSTTFKVRVGGDNNPHYLNGSNQGDVQGGKQYSSIIVQEISV